MAEYQNTTVSSGEMAQRFIEFVMMQAQNAAFMLGCERLSDARRAAGTLSALEATAGLTSAGCVAGTAVRGRG